MAWSELQQASFKGIVFEVDSASDDEQREVVLHAYPYLDGADAEDLGRAPKRVRFGAIVWSQSDEDDYQPRLDALLAALRSAEPGELVHPVFGTMARALCLAWRAEHGADLRDGCRLTLEFIEAGAAARVFEVPSPVLAAEKITAQGDTARAAADEAMVGLVERVVGGPVPRVLALKAAMNSAMGKLRLLADTTSLKLLLSDLDPIFYPRAYVADARAILDRALQGLPFGGRNVLFEGSTTQASSGLADFGRAAAALGPQAVALTAPNADGLMVQAHARVHAACSLAEAAAIVLVAEIDDALLDRADIEQMAAATRTAIQAGIEGMRAACPDGCSAEAGAALRALAYEVQVAARAVIEARPPVVLRASPVAGPLRLVAHALYGDHTRAAELVRLNAFGRTLVAEYGQELKAYAR